jgi:hypothetical protein
LTTVNLFVKYDETSSPREAISAISSAVGLFALSRGLLDAFRIPLLLFFGGLPSRDKVIILAPAIAPNFENDGAQAPAAPTDGTKLFRIIIPLIDDMHLIEYLLRLLQTDAMVSFDGPTLSLIELEPHRRI